MRSSTAPYIWDSAETLPQKERERLQLARLRACIARVSSVPFYAEQLRSGGVTAENLRSLDDLLRLPFTTKEHLREHYPFGLLAVPSEQVVRVHGSSGTTGKLTLVGYTRADLELWAEMMARALAAAGVRPGDIVQNAYGYGLFTGGLGFHDGATRIGATVLPISGGNTQRQIQLMHDLGTTVLCSTPTYALLLAEVLETMDDVRGALRLRVGMFGGEPWSEQLRATLEARLGLMAVDHYGLSEIIGPGVAAECSERQGLHINEDHFLPEVIDPDTGERLPDGVVGELVLTCVTKEALPLLRYRTRDRTRLLREPCACGRTTVRMERVQGRTDDMLIVRGVNLFPSQIETALLAFGEIEPHYQIIVERTGGVLDELEVVVEAPTRLAEQQEAWGALEGQLARRLHDALGLHCRVRVVAPQSLPRSTGKATRVIDRRTL